MHDGEMERERERARPPRDFLVWLVVLVNGQKNLQPGSKRIPTARLHGGFLLDSICFHGEALCRHCMCIGTGENRVDASLVPPPIVIDPI